MIVAAHASGMLGFVWPGGAEWVILLVLGLLIFGRRLPEVGRSLGKGIVEFKRGIKGIEDEVEAESSRPGKIARDPASPELEAPPESRVSRAGAQAIADRAAGPEAGGDETDMPDMADTADQAGEAAAKPSESEAERAPR